LVVSIQFTGSGCEFHVPEAANWRLSLKLLGFLVQLVLAAAATELLELEAASGRLLVLGGRIVPLFALGALQCDDIAHFEKPF